jgi:hypothetical protein
MNVRVRAILAAAALAAAIAPLGARAASGNIASLDLATRQYDPATAGQYEGRLRLRITPDGVVAGSFMNTEGSITTVIGGLTGTKIWIDLAAGSPGLQRLFRGTLTGGKLRATAPHGIDTWILEGTPYPR